MCHMKRAIQKKIPFPSFSTYYFLILYISVVVCFHLIKIYYKEAFKKEKQFEAVVNGGKKCNKSIATIQVVIHLLCSLDYDYVYVGQIHHVSGKLAEVIIEMQKGKHKGCGLYLLIPTGECIKTQKKVNSSGLVYVIH